MDPSAVATAERQRSVWKPVVALVAAMWCVELLDVVLPGDATSLGIRSREVAGLPGIVAAPLLHTGWGHLLANTVPLVVLGLLVSWRAGRAFWPVVAVIVLVGGLGVWLLGPAATVTVGASGLVFGLLTYLITAGIVTRRFVDVLLGVLVTLVYGGLLWSTLPWFVPAEVSWLGHLCGAAAGVLAALLFTRPADGRDS
jgi:membrane associated rhomboid family serine protease